MGTIIRNRYPASKLPPDLREGVNPRSTVTVTIVEESPAPEKVVTLDEIFAARRPPFRTVKDIDDELRRQRDDWDD